MNYKYEKIDTSKTNVKELKNLIKKNLVCFTDNNHQEFQDVEYDTSIVILGKPSVTLYKKISLHYWAYYYIVNELTLRSWTSNECTYEEAYNQIESCEDIDEFMIIGKIVLI